MAGKFEITQTPSGKFMFNLKASNGQVILTSQMYAAKDSAKKGAESVMKNAPQDELYERRESKKGE
ncbi:MAG: YegP family protein, partial [Desulfohalobiaceae bacterium]